MATAKKLPSGSWRCRVFSHYEIRPDGSKKAVYESFVVKDPSKRGKRECERLAAEWSVNRQDRNVMDMIVQDAIRGYIDAKEKVLSPSTITGYNSLARSSYGEIALYAIGELKPPIVQAWINALSSRVGPKTVRNANALFGAALGFYGGPSFHPTLPTPETYVPHVPDDEEVRKLIEYIRDGIAKKDGRDKTPRRELLICIMLAAFCSLRRGEICALTLADIDTEEMVVHVSKDMVLDSDGFWVIKPTPKTSTSNRAADLPQFVADEITDYVAACKRRILPESRLFTATPDMISNRFDRAVHFSGAENRFRLHDLRHYYVSIAHALGIPDAYIMEMGGWKTETVMKRVYRATLADRRKVERDKLSAHFEQMHSVDKAENS